MKDELLGNLPDPFLFADGHRVSTKEDWERRRGEILCDTVALEFGGMPPYPVTYRENGIRLEPLTQDCYRIHCGTDTHPFTFCFQVYRPENCK